MCRRFVLTALLLLAVSARARADMAFPGLVERTPAVRFEGLIDYPEYAFFLKYDRHSWSVPSLQGVSRPQVVLVAPRQDIPLAGNGRWICAVLVAAPRDQVSTEGRVPSAGWLSPGVLESQLLHISSEQFFAGLADHDIHPYRVAIHEGSLLVSPLPVETAFWPRGAVAVAIFVAILIGVLAFCSLLWRTWADNRRRPGVSDLTPP
jgi:hypothetical protein